MALTAKQKAKLKRLRNRFDIGPGYGSILRDAIIFDWSETQLIRAVTKSKVFRRQFPGILEGGNLSDFLTGQENASLSASNLAKAIGNYKQLWQAYETAGQAFGFGKLNRNQIATLIRSERSPDEFAAGAYAVRQVTQNAEAFAIYNQQRKAMGLKPLERKELFRAVARRDRKFIDTIEAARLRQLGEQFGFSAQEAQAIAKGLPNFNAQGRPTGYVDPGALVNELRSQMADIGPELKAAGITDVQIAKFLANPDSDPDNISSAIQRVIAARRGTGGFVQGRQVSQGPGGGPQTASSPGPVSYG